MLLSVSGPHSSEEQTELSQNAVIITEALLQISTQQNAAATVVVVAESTTTVLVADQPKPEVATISNKSEFEKPQRYATFDPIVCERVDEPTKMIQYPFLKEAIPTSSFFLGELVYIAALPLAQALIGGSSMATATAKEDRVKASRFICRFSVLTGKALADSVKRNTIENALVVRLDGLWNFLTAIAPNKISMNVRMSVYETLRTHFGGPLLPMGLLLVPSSKKEVVGHDDTKHDNDDATSMMKPSSRIKKEPRHAEEEEKPNPYDSTTTNLHHRKKKREEDDSTKDHHDHHRSTEFKRSHASSRLHNHIHDDELAFNEAVLTSRVRLDAQAKHARAIALRDMIHKEEILEEGRCNLIRALKKELQLRKEIAAI